MLNQLPRVLLATSSAILVLGGLMHARALGKAAAALTSSNVPDFYTGAFKAVWLIDSTTLIVLAVVCAVLAAAPGLASGAIVVLLALIPAGTAVLQYTFLGAFFPAHLLLASALMMVVAGVVQVRGT